MYFREELYSVFYRGRFRKHLLDRKMEIIKFTEDQVYMRLQILRDSMDGSLRRQARRELLESDQETLNTVLDRMLSNETDTETLAYVAELIVESKGERKAERILLLLQATDRSLRQHICGLLANCGDKTIFSIYGSIDSLGDTYP